MMEIFSASPRSFKMDRRSPFASSLRVSVAEKLVEFLGNYTDDVLAEYIIVLVCNGKHQNQARDDLEAFLGERSGEFVSWLWDFLQKNAHQSKYTVNSSDLQDITVTNFCDDDVDKKWRINRLMDLQSHDTGDADNPPTKDKKYYGMSIHGRNSVSSNDVEASEGFQQWHSGFAAPLDEVNTKDVEAQTCRNEISKISVATEDNHDKAMMSGAYRMRGSSGISAGGEQIMQYVDQYNKMVSSSCNALPHQLLYSPKRELVSRKVRPVTVGAMLSSRDADSISLQNARPRRNVWDRLGKPHEDNTTVRDEKINACGVDIIKRKMLEHNGEWLDQHRLMPFVSGARRSRRLKGEVPVPDSSHGTVIPITNCDEYRRREHGVNMCTLDDASNIRRKRRFGEIGPGPDNGSDSLVGSRARHLQDEEIYKEFQGSSVVSHTQVWKSIVSETRKSDDLDTRLRSDISHNPRAKKMSQAPEAANQTLVSVNCSLPVKSESINYENGVNANLKPVQAKVLDVKIRLRQIEMEMSKLRSKQVEMNNDGKLNILLSSGALNHQKEDAELRTVLVTNVHFAATREALSLHFSKCGVVVKVIILADEVTAQPKGSAYITFASKESVDKAVALSGNSFMSRTLKVMRKGEVPSATSAPSQVAGKTSQLWSANINRKAIHQRPYSSSHLQWRRDVPENADHSIPAPGTASETSITIEEQGVGNSTSQQLTHSVVSLRTTKVGSYTETRTAT